MAYPHQISKDEINEIDKDKGKQTIERTRSRAHSILQVLREDNKGEIKGTRSRGVSFLAPPVPSVPSKRPDFTEFADMSNCESSLFYRCVAEVYLLNSPAIGCLLNITAQYKYIYGTQKDTWCGNAHS